MNKLAACVIAIAICLFSSRTHAADAMAFSVAMSDHATIDPNKDHYTVAIDSFWISSKDSVFQSIFGSTKTGAVSLSANAVLFDADATTLSVQTTHNLEDVKSVQNQPIGLKQTLIEGLPADANFKFSFKIALYKGNKIGDTLDALEKSKASIPGDIFAGTWFGYARAASTVINSLFSVSDTKYPFAFEGDVKAGVVAADGTMPSRYIVIISPSSPNDAAFLAIDQDKLSYDETHGRVLYNAQPLTTWSHAVLKVSKAPSPNIGALVFGSSAPWAQLAQSQILRRPQSAYKTPAEIRTSAEAIDKSLQDILTFLKKEPRFSKLDRALAMKSFANIAVRDLTDSCQTVSGDDNSCGLKQLKDLSNTVDELFGLIPVGTRSASLPIDPSLSKELADKSAAIQEALLSTRALTR
jgi:hypothetical protein